jgi:hypothetical protein
MTVSKAARYARRYAASLLVYFLARQFTPLLYPNKHFDGATNGEILAMVLRSFGRIGTYEWPYPFMCFIYFGAINLLCFPLLRRQRSAVTVALNLMLGIYFGIMIDGYVGVEIDVAVRSLVYARWPDFSQSPILDLVPLVLKVGVPILAAFVVAQAGMALGRAASPPDSPDGLAST